MSNRLNILAVGANPFITFYVSRLANVASLDVSVVSQEAAVVAAEGFSWKSTEFGNSCFRPSPSSVFASVTDLTQKPKTYDCLLMSAKSLQDISVVVSQLAGFLTPTATIIIESTGYVKLESFVKLSLPATLSSVNILSIMTDHDVRKTGPASYTHTVTGNTSQTYIGKAETPTDIYSGDLVGLIYSWANIFENCGLKVATFRTTTEFLATQVQLCVPRAVFNPLAIIFEIPYPANFEAQILSKPLISGLIEEFNRLAKCMNVAVPKELVLYRQWCLRYKQLQGVDTYATSSPLFYDFFHQRDLEIDLLLLQPILLADDYNLRTPYLEFLYAVLCQHQKLNRGQSVFFMRGSSADVQRLRDSVHAKDQCLLTAQEEIKRQQAQIAQLQEETKKLVKARPMSTAYEGSDLSDFRDIAMYGAQLNGEAVTQGPARGSATPTTLASSDGDPDYKALYEREVELKKREIALAAREMDLRARQPQAQSQAQPFLSQAQSQGFSQPQGFPQAQSQGIPQTQPQGFPQAQPQGFPQAQPQGFPQAQLQGFPQAQSQGFPQAQSQGFSQAQSYSQQGPSQNQPTQVPPQGLPTNGLPPNGLPQKLRSASYTSVPQSFGSQHPVPHQGFPPRAQHPNPGPPNGRRLMSLGGMPTYSSQQQPQPQPQPYDDGLGVLLTTGVIDSEIESRFKQKSKANRRSGYPMHASTDMLGGMPNPKTRPKHKSMVPMMGAGMGNGGMPTIVTNGSSPNLSGSASQRFSQPPQLAQYNARPPNLANGSYSQAPGSVAASASGAPSARNGMGNRYNSSQNLTVPQSAPQSALQTPQNEETDSPLANSTMTSEQTRQTVEAAPEMVNVVIDTGEKVKEKKKRGFFGKKKK
ncbi:hypothetical protein BABINDRAFT_5255 [Babjeviella inositovora NRRL Y-12698]|uniref:Ketopantoate reductase C-terminal domain-containing protein n=1 Tax=Babjeviella inositovora NRRL Y-12698 TaxID=984486 RepID=A0A1E3QXC9_9ASCO|nr:uncharacterized protein BABINDRAFT_5255 [Babjeviella inositovora NRRL Y-12698]ODQ82261.1 hypothetical protein BABINDRAFT_5255 [Babjeviella inositovora NRRL Y-12698]